jgi:hypothetical protein
MFDKNGNSGGCYQHHVATYGDPFTTFGYDKFLGGGNDLKGNPVKISDAANLAIHSMAHIARSKDKANHSVGEIAEKQGVWEAHLSKVMQRLMASSWASCTSLSSTSILRNERMRPCRPQKLGTKSNRSQLCALARR